MRLIRTSRLATSNHGRFGIQREFKKDNVIEFRYTGNRGQQAVAAVATERSQHCRERIYNELVLAQQKPDRQHGQRTRCAIPLPGSPARALRRLPILFGYIPGRRADVGQCVELHQRSYLYTLYASGNWSSSTFINPLNPLGAQPLLFANGLTSTVV
jgi:hypothetical protein